MTRTKALALAIVLGVAAAGAIAIYPTILIGAPLLFVALLILIIGVIPFKGLTLVEWRRTQRKKMKEDAILVSSTRHNNGIIINGGNISVFLELTATPYRLNRGDLGVTLPLETISNFFTTAGARLHQITVHSIAQKSAGTTAFSKIYTSALPKDTISNVQTVVEVTFNIGETTHEIYRRAAVVDEDLDDDAITVGVTRFAEAVAATLRNALIADNIDCRVLTAPDIEVWHKNVNLMIGNGMKKPKRDVLPGSKTSPAVRMFISPSADVPPSITKAADAVLVSRQFQPDGGIVRSRTVVGMVANNGAPPKGIKDMTVALQQQYACGTVVDPTRKTEHVEGSWSRDKQGNLDSLFPLAGAGVRLGASAVLDRTTTGANGNHIYVQGTDTVFMALSGARGSIVWTSIPDSFLLVIMLRMQSAGERVFFLTADPARTDEMRRYSIPVGKVAPEGATVVVVDHGMPTSSGAAYMTWALTTKPPRSGLYSIVADETGSTVIRARGVARRVFWTHSVDEQAFIATTQKNR